MRVLVYILSSWVLYLSVAPCCSEDEVCLDEPCTEVASTITDYHLTPVHTDYPSGDQDQSCPPFLLCGNCSGFVVSPSTFLSETTIPQVPIEVNVSFALPHWTSAWLPPVWQPPQTS